MSRLHLTEVTVEALPEPCGQCLFWEAGGKPGPEVDDDERAAARVAKESWWQATALEWGSCGIGAWQGDRLLGYVTVAPASYLGGAAKLGRVTDDALLMGVLWIDEETAPEGTAAWLVEAALRQVAARGARALEAFGSPTGKDSCVPAEAVLQACGFELLRWDQPYPHYRLDLRRTARWHERAEEAVVALRRVLRGRKLGRVPSMPSTVTRGR